jgi:hypothetical protein
MDRFPWQTVKLLEGGLNGIDFVLICFLSLQIAAAGAAVDGMEIGVCHRREFLTKCRSFGIDLTLCTYLHLFKSNETHCTRGGTFARQLPLEYLLQIHPRLQQKLKQN